MVRALARCARATRVSEKVLMNQACMDAQYVGKEGGVHTKVWQESH